jgi:hypothetical protein
MRAVSSSVTVSERTPRALPLGIAASLALAVIIAVPVATLAGKATSAVWVNELSAKVSSGVGGLKFGDHFTVGYDTRERQPFALARCYANGTTQFVGTNADGSVWGEVFSVYAGGPTPQDFQLGASVYQLWTGGGADCTVQLVKYSSDLSRMTVLATTRFTAPS